MNTASSDERRGLLGNNGRTLGHAASPCCEPDGSATENASPLRVLPLALLAALAMAATAATTILTYASLLCHDATHCEDEERNKYAGSVAAATSAANACSLVAFSPLERLSRKNHHSGLLLWFILRSMSVVMLVIGCRYRNHPSPMTR